MIHRRGRSPCLGVARFGEQPRQLSNRLALGVVHGGVPLWTFAAYRIPRQTDEDLPTSVPRLRTPLSLFSI